MFKSASKLLNRTRTGLASRSVRLRNLDQYEVNIIKRGVDQNMLMKVRVWSRIDLFVGDNLKLFQNSLSNWVRSQKFLSSRILKTGDNEYYFDHMRHQSGEFENVKLLRVNREGLTDETLESVSDLLVEKCVSTEIHPDKYPEKLLWNLYVFELGRNSRVYDVTMSYHHTIAQAKAAYLNISHLFELTDKAFNNKDTRDKQFDVFSGIESHFGLGGEFKSLPKIEFPTPGGRPSFIDPTRARSDQLSQSPQSNLNPEIEVLHADSGLKFSSVGELLDTSRNNHIKFKLIDLGESTTASLLDRCKREGAKLNGCIEVISSLALRDLYHKYGSVDELDKIIYFNVVSLRNFVKNKPISEETLGYSGSLLFHMIERGKIDEIVNNPDNLDSLFWSLARNLSNSLHERLKTDEWKDVLRLQIRDPNHFRRHFLLSNVGQLHPPALDNFTIENRLALGYFDPDVNNRLFGIYFYTNSSSQRFSAVIHYNSWFIDSNMVFYYCKHFSNWINRVLKK